MMILGINETDEASNFLVTPEVGFTSTYSVRTQRKSKQFYCRFCGRGFVCKWSLKTHMTVHTGELLYACKRCDERFRYRSQLSRHRLTCCKGQVREIRF